MSYKFFVRFQPEDGFFDKCKSPDLFQERRKEKEPKQNKANDLFANGIYNRGQRETRRFHDTHCRPTGGAVELIQSSFQRETREDIDTPRSPSDRPPFFFPSRRRRFSAIETATTKGAVSQQLGNSYSIGNVKRKSAGGGLFRVMEKAFTERKDDNNKTSVMKVSLPRK